MVIFHGYVKLPGGMFFHVSNSFQQFPTFFAAMNQKPGTQGTLK
jgi:hypothetical protein